MKPSISLIRNTMDQYKVKVTPRAFRDLDEIYNYIAMEKLAPENAKRQTNRIRAALKTLGTMPQSHQDRLTGRYAGKGYKQLLVDNYMAIYKIDEDRKIVQIVTIQYQGRNV